MRLPVSDRERDILTPFRPGLILANIKEGLLRQKDTPTTFEKRDSRLTLPAIFPPTQQTVFLRSVVERDRRPDEERVQTDLQLLAAETAHHVVETDIVKIVLAGGCDDHTGTQAASITKRHYYTHKHMPNMEDEERKGLPEQNAAGAFADADG